MRNRVSLSGRPVKDKICVVNIFAYISEFYWHSLLA